MLPSGRCNASQFPYRQRSFKMGCVINPFLLCEANSHPTLVNLLCKSQLFITAWRILPMWARLHSNPLRALAFLCSALLPSPVCLRYPGPRRGVSVPPQFSGLREHPSWPRGIRKLPSWMRCGKEHWTRFKTLPYIAPLPGANLKRDSSWGGNRERWGEGCSLWGGVADTQSRKWEVGLDLASGPPGPRPRYCRLLITKLNLLSKATVSASLSFCLCRRGH